MCSSDLPLLRTHSYQRFHHIYMGPGVSGLDLEALPRELLLRGARFWLFLYPFARSGPPLASEMGAPGGPLTPDWSPESIENRCGVDLGPLVGPTGAHECPGEGNPSQKDTISDKKVLFRVDETNLFKN